MLLYIFTPVCMGGGRVVHAGTERDGPQINCRTSGFSKAISGDLLLLSSYCHISRMITIVLEWGLFNDHQIFANPVHNTDITLGSLRLVDIEDLSSSVNSSSRVWLNFTSIYEHYLFLQLHPAWYRVYGWVPAVIWRKLGVRYKLWTKGNASFLLCNIRWLHLGISGSDISFVRLDRNANKSWALLQTFLDFM